MQIRQNLTKTATLFILFVVALLVAIPCADVLSTDASLRRLEVDFGDDGGDGSGEVAFIEIEATSTDPAPTSLQWRNASPYANSGIANAAYVAVVPNVSGGTQYVTPASGIVFPQAYWNGNQTTNPIRLASGMLDTFDDSSGAQYGSLPTGTQVVLVAQAPEYAPVGGMSPATNPAPAGSWFTGPYSSPNSVQSVQSTGDPNFRSALSERYDQMMSFHESMEFSVLWMSDSGNRPLGNTELRGQTRFAIPCQMFGNDNFYVAPAFQVNFWNNTPTTPEYAYTMRNTTFGGWIGAGINPHLGNEFRFDLEASVGVYSDFSKITSDCIYVRGAACGYYQYSKNTLELMAGVIYLNRERIKLMPTFGVIWKPNPHFECLLTFPDVRILRQIYTVNGTEWWAFARAEYGGGSWAVNTDQGVFRTDYNDIRVALGLEFRNKSKQCLSGYFEVGGAFNRELYSNGHAWYKPSSCVFLAGGLRY
jgi:hypothetical protein